MTINGALVTNDKEEAIIQNYLDDDDFEKLKDICLKYDVAFAYKFDEAVVIYNHYLEFIDNYTNGVEYPKILIDNTQDQDYHHNHQAYGCFVVGDNDILDKIRDEITTVKWSKCYDKAMECYRKDISKLSGIDYVLNKYHLTRDNLMAFGDGENDIEMLQYAAIGVALNNADPKLKKVADYISSDCDKGGIHKALRHYKII